MKVAVLSHHSLETEGLKWIIQSHMYGVEMTIGTLNDSADCFIIDMDLWDAELEAALKQKGVPWIGLSSDRTFLTAYRALKAKAEDLLFRPFDPMLFVRQLQQIRFRLRNAPVPQSLDTAPAVSYPDLFTGRAEAQGMVMAAFAVNEDETVAVLTEALKRYPFSHQTEVFSLTDFVLLVYFAEEAELCIRECRSFLASWKKETDAPLSVFVNGQKQETIRAYYQETRKLISLIFYEGFDITLLERRRLDWQPLDPFLTPLEQRTWIKMLEKKETAAIQQWMEEEFLSYRRPYPDPEMIRVRLTSVLAQVRRYMKSAGVAGDEWESRYHAVFDLIVRGPVVYSIVQKMIRFMADLLQEAGHRQGAGGHTVAEKARELMEANYWDAAWGLSSCAEALRLSESTLSRRFKQQTGRRFREMLLEIRLREAKRLLTESALSLEEIARLTGFTYGSYFSAVFKKLEGHTPSDFRKGR